MSEKSTFLKKLTPRSRTYELRGQGEKKSKQNKDKQTPHTVLQKLSPKLTPTLLTPKQLVARQHTSKEFENLPRSIFEKLTVPSEFSLATTVFSVILVKRTAEV